MKKKHILHMNRLMILLCWRDKRRPVKVRGRSLNGGDDIIHEFPLRGVFGTPAGFLTLFSCYPEDHKEPYPEKNTRQGLYVFIHKTSPFSLRIA